MSLEVVFSKSQQLAHYLILASLLFLAIVVLHFYQDLLNLFLVVLAYFAGIFLLWLDEFHLHRFYREADNRVLVTRSTIFLFSLPLLSIFVLTSTGSLLGVAMIMAINSYLCLEMWTLSQEPIFFKERFFSSSQMLSIAQIKKICLFTTVYVIIMWSMWLWL